MFDCFKGISAAWVVLVNIDLGCVQKSEARSLGHHSSMILGMSFVSTFQCMENLSASNRFIHCFMSVDEILWSK